VIDPFPNAASEPQPMCGDVAMDHFLETGFVDRHFASLQCFDFPRVVIDADNVVAHVGEASAGDKTDVTGTDDGKIHVNEATQRVSRSGANGGPSPGKA